MMSIPLEIIALVEQLNRELDEIERSATEGIQLSRILLDRFPENIIMIEMFAFLNSVIFLVDTEKNQVEKIIQTLVQINNVTQEEIELAGQDLAAKLGRLLETKVRVIQITSRLEDLQ